MRAVVFSDVETVDLRDPRTAPRPSPVAAIICPVLFARFVQCTEFEAWWKEDSSAADNMIDRPRLVTLKDRMDAMMQGQLDREADVQRVDFAKELADVSISQKKKQVDEEQAARAAAAMAKTGDTLAEDMAARETSNADLLAQAQAQSQAQARTQGVDFMTDLAGVDISSKKQHLVNVPACSSLEDRIFLWRTLTLSLALPHRRMTQQLQSRQDRRLLQSRQDRRLGSPPGHRQLQLWTKRP